MIQFTNEEYLDCEDWWSPSFDITYKGECIPINSSKPVETWLVENKKSGHTVICSSKLMACKIATVASEIMEGLPISCDHSVVLRKAFDVLGRTSQWINGKYSLSKLKRGSNRPKLMQISKEEC